LVRFAVSTFNILAFARAPDLGRDGLNPVAVIHATRLGCTEEYRRRAAGVLHEIGLERANSPFCCPFTISVRVSASKTVNGSKSFAGTGSETVSL
jgi:hypothetical protein